MSDSNKLQAYKYSLRTATLAGSDNHCGRRRWFYLVAPQKSITIENINTHFVFQFDSGVASGDRKIVRIGIMNAENLSQTVDSDYTRAYDIDESADGNRIVDLKMDLTALLQKTDAGYQDILDDNVVGRTLIFIDFPVALELTNNVGDLKLWKADALYTTEGIR